VSRSEWNDDEQDEPAPLPAHERAWRHPSEIGEHAWMHSEPPLTIGRGLTAATGAIGGLLALAVLWTMLPTQAGRGAGAAAQSTIAKLTETGLAAERTTVAVTATSAPTTEPGPSATPTTRPVAVNHEPTESSIGVVAQRPLPTYQLTEGSTVTLGAVAVAVNGGSLVITTSRAVTADLTVELLLPDGRTETARVLFVDDRSGLAVLAPETAHVVEAFTVATAVVPGDQLTFFGDVQLTITVGDDNSIDGSWADDSSIREGTPVVNQRGELVALCSHADGVARLVQLANLDDLQQAIAAYTGTAKVWLGIALNDAPSGELSISAVEPAGPAASAGVTSGDVIVTIDGAAIANRQALTTALAIHVPGDVVQLGILRSDGTSLTLAITLADPKTTL
jgi:S1-C subfamily serine protease